MARVDKYGRGSAAANGEGFVDLVPGDTFSALEEQLKRRIADRFDNPVLDISASIGSKRNASELAKHLASGEEEEAHKFAAKNIGVLFAKGGMGVVHFDKKAVDETREKPEIFRVFSPFVFAGEPLVATITIKPAADGLRLYAIEALDIMRGERLEVHLAAKPRQFKTTRLLLTDRIAYYVGDVNRTHPKFIRRNEPFSVSRTAELLEEQMQPMANGQSPATDHQAPSTKHQAPKFAIIIPVYNVAPYLRECLDSVLAQTFTDWEAICVDDGSTDGSALILDEYARRDSRFRVFHQNNRGVSSARNNALENACGEWLLFVDGDDVIAPDSLARISEITDESDFDAYFTRLPHDMRMGERPLQKAVGSGLCYESINRPSLGKQLLFGPEILPGAPVMRILRRSIFGNRMFPPGVPMMEDTLNLIDVLSVRARWTRVDLKIYSYRIYQSSSHIVNVGRTLGLIDVFARLYDDSIVKLGCAQREAIAICRQSYDALMYFMMGVVGKARVCDQIVVAQKYLALEDHFHEHFLSPFMRLRCKILVSAQRPIFFGLISFCEWVWFGVRNRFFHPVKMRNEAYDP